MRGSWRFVPYLDKFLHPYRDNRLIENPKYFILASVWRASKHLREGLFVCLFVLGATTSPYTPPSWPWPPHSRGFLDHTQRRTTVGRTPLDEWSARRRDLYLTTHNTHNRQTFMPPVRFEPTISAGQRPQTCALDPAATATGFAQRYWNKFEEK